MEIVDFRNLDGEPWDIAKHAGRQVDECFTLLDRAMETLFWSARGAWLSQQDHRTGKMPTGEDFVASPVGRKLASALDATRAARRAAQVVTAAASHDPRSV